MKNINITLSVQLTKIFTLQPAIRNEYCFVTHVTTFIHFFKQKKTSLEKDRIMVWVVFKRRGYLTSAL